MKYDKEPCNHVCGNAGKPNCVKSLQFFTLKTLLSFYRFGGKKIQLIVFDTENDKMEKLTFA